MIFLIYRHILNHPTSRHFYPGASERFPALSKISYLDPVRALLLSGAICTSVSPICLKKLTMCLSDCSWQLLYYKFVLVDRRHKIESGERTTSFSYLLNDQRGAIGKFLSSIPPQHREKGFIVGQLCKLIPMALELVTYRRFSQYMLC